MWARFGKKRMNSRLMWSVYTNTEALLSWHLQTWLKHGDDKYHLGRFADNTVLWFPSYTTDLLRGCLHSAVTLPVCCWMPARPKWWWASPAPKGNRRQLSMPWTMLCLLEMQRSTNTWIPPSTISCGPSPTLKNLLHYWPHFFSHSIPHRL